MNHSFLFTPYEERQLDRFADYITSESSSLLVLPSCSLQICRVFSLHKAYYEKKSRKLANQQ
jgi:hypothetical protein